MRIHGILLEDVVLTIFRLTDEQSDTYSVIQLANDVCKEFGKSNRLLAKEMSVALKELRTSHKTRALRDYRKNYLGHRLQPEFSEYRDIVDDAADTLDNIKKILSNMHLVLGGDGDPDHPAVIASKASAQNFWKCVVRGVS